jgi:hypothetical protein
MVIVIAQSRKLTGFFGSLAYRFYNGRLANAEREVDRHRQFLHIPKTW